LTAEWGRLIGPYGTIAVELGDTYAGGNGEGSDTRGKGHPPKSAKGGAIGELVNHKGSGWPLDKSLCCIPQLYEVALAYGINPLTGQPSPAGRWRVRNLVAWCRPNPPVGALGDKFRPATSYMTIATKARDRWFDLDAVRSEHKYPDDDRSKRPSVKTSTRSERLGAVLSNGGNPAGAPPLDWWQVSTEATEAETSRLVRVPVDGHGDDIQRTTSPDCPLHGSPRHPGSSAPHDAHGDDQPSRTGHTDGRHAQAQLDGFAPTSQTLDPSGSSPASSPADAAAATRRSRTSDRTGPDPVTSLAGTPSARSSHHTAGTPTSPESTDPDRDMDESSTSAACLPADEHETPPRTSGKSDPSQACSCSYYVEVEVGNSNNSSHYATWPSDHWNISTEAFSGSHYATWPRKLLERPIKAMCPLEVCRQCGEPRRRIVGDAEYVPSATYSGGMSTKDAHDMGGRLQGRRQEASLVRSVDTLGWTDCGHGGDYRHGIVLDPFAGSGTTLAVATGHGRDAIGIDIDSRNVALVEQRVGMFLTVVEPDAAA
jgi:hypothetical protein